MLRTGAAAAVLGFIFGFVEGSIWGGIYMWVVLYAIGFAAGKVLHKIAAHKLGKKVVATILGGFVVGAMLSPAGEILLGKNFMSTAFYGTSLENDPEFIANAAIKAKKHFPEFEKAFREQLTGQRFLVKAPFEDGDEIEHLWLHVDGIDGERISGRLVSDPEEIGNVHQGDKKTVNLSSIDDFSYTDQDEIAHGSFSVDRNANRKRLSGYNNPFRTSSCWVHLLVLAFGIVSPVLAVKIRN